MTEHWYWSHDIQPHQIDSITTPGFRLVRLSCYRTHADRFAAVFHQSPGPARTHALDLSAQDLEGVAGRPVAVTVNTAGAEPRFALVLEGAGDATVVKAGLDDTALHAIDGRILDLDTYLSDGVRRYVAVVDPHAGPSLVFTDLSRRRLTRALRKHNAVPTAIRPAGEDRFVAAGVPSSGHWDWYTDVDADTVAGKLDRHGAYPADLDATRTPSGTRYTVVVRSA